MPSVDAVTAWIESAGPLAYAGAPAFTILVAILPIPAEIPAMLNGVLFGPILGVAVTWAASLLGAWISFELARRWGRPLGRRLVPAGWLDSADALVTRGGWPALLTLRLIPTVAFTAVNWTAGLTGVDRRTFLWTTAVGILPGAAAFTLTGSGLVALLRGMEGRAILLLVVAVAALLLATTGYWMRGVDRDEGEP